MLSSNDPPRAERVQVITSVQRRRHWTTQEKGTPVVKAAIFVEAACQAAIG
ncbi:hypothetical protein [Methylobacterium radiotolerans]|uniref:hypothetical protein n=1 Tax=Methylobacterium radiotolerans TaxID=31998 RepID=UPI001F1CA1E8|nr:hypothetical protein [Methylobacterium radiotolerans]UIY43249.1 hypothetical protein LZ599_05850 [Methylobacterium radiotolerans]